MGRYLSSFLYKLINFFIDELEINLVEVKSYLARGGRKLIKVLSLRGGFHS